MKSLAMGRPPDGQRNLADHQNADWAIFLPALATVYVQTVSRDQWRLSARPNLPTTRVQPRHLDWLDPANPYFFYPWALYSAGHADLNPQTYPTRESMIAQRDRARTWVLGDSGGFQAATGVLKYPWVAKANETAEALRQRQDQVKARILRWLEATADWGMVFDFPTFASTMSRARENGLVSFDACLKGSQENFQYFAEQKHPETKLYTILQGHNQQQRDRWWEAVKDYPFDGFAWSIATSSNVYALLDRLVAMIREGRYLTRRPTMLHFFGVAKPLAAIAFTAIQRALRKHINPDTHITFDASTPFSSAARGELFDGIFFTGRERAPSGRHGRVGFLAHPIADDAPQTASGDPPGWSYTAIFGDPRLGANYQVDPSPIARDITNDDIFNPQTKRPKDLISYCLMMHHNVFVQIRGLQDANRLFDATPRDQLEDYFPNRLVRFAKLIAVDDLFSARDLPNYIDRVVGADQGRYPGGYVEAIIANAGNGDISTRIIERFREDLLNLFDITWDEWQPADIWTNEVDPPTDVEPITDTSRQGEMTMAEIFEEDEQ